MVGKIAPSGFREYDARWRFPDQIDQDGMRGVGLALGTQMAEEGLQPEMAVGHDYRSYSATLHDALIDGLVRAGVTVHDIGLCVTPMAYFAQIHLDVSGVAMVTASHNPNGWTGVKMGLEAPLTHGPEEMARLRDIVLNGEATTRDGGRRVTAPGVKKAYLDDLVRDISITRPLKAVCATGNGTAGLFAPEVLRRIGVDVVPRHTDLDDDFPNYNPNPEALEMLHDMAEAVRDSGSDLALGFDGDGDRCGVVDGAGAEIFADKMGVLLARDYAQQVPGARFVVDIKSTGIYAIDPVLRAAGAETEYWKTGHSHMKRRVHSKGAMAGFEKSGHYFLGAPVGHGYDDGIRTAVEICRLLDRNPEASLADLLADLPRTWITPTLSPYCADNEKYGVVERLTHKLQGMLASGGTLAGRRMTDVLTINGARVTLENGAWALVRASSNTPNLVVVCESPESEAEMRAVFDDLDRVIRSEPLVGDYDQMI